jgi:hypothetical protein
MYKNKLKIIYSQYQQNQRIQEVATEMFLCRKENKNANELGINSERDRRNLIYVEQTQTRNIHSIYGALQADQNKPNHTKQTIHNQTKPAPTHPNPTQS